MKHDRKQTSQMEQLAEMYKTNTHKMPVN